ncbi:MAG TPA: hypothetical protein VND91_11710 [Candidatus Saccharimonadia bacterium]|nr:hypothetical protein [Candidatus Saccharimonadia bacterium]
MSLEQASYLSQIVVAIAIVPSLLFVGVQLMQNTKAVRTSASQAHAALYHQIVASLVDDAEFARIWREALADFEARTPDERVRFLAFTSTLFRFYESSHVQWLRGQLDREHWHTIEQMAASLSAQPGIKAWWALRRYWHSEKFRRWFEGLAPLPASALYGMIARGSGSSADG